MKVAVVGGGSTYTPELADGFARLRSVLAIDELVLMDPSYERLAVVGPFCARLFDRHGHPGRVSWTSNVDEGVDGAEIVLIQLRVGGQRARISDETFPMEYGCVGQETTGAGGFAKALRTVPVVLDVAERVASLAAPGAWIVDFTNPVGIVTRALLDNGRRAVGLCNVAIGLQRSFAAHLGVGPSDVLLDHIGLNHLTWERAAFVDGVDVLPKLLAERRSSAIFGMVIIAMLWAGAGGWLRDCLSDIRAWSDVHPSHLPITVQLDLKPGDLGFWGWDSGSKAALDSTVAQQLGAKVYQPEALRAYRHAQYDQQEWDRMVDRVSADRGVRVYPSCCFNDLRPVDHAEQSAPPPNPAQAAYATATLEWLPGLDHFNCDFCFTVSRQTGVLALASTVHNQKRELVMEGVQRYLIKKRPS